MIQNIKCRKETWLSFTCRRSVVPPQVYPNSTALVVSTENITQNWYFGEERSMLIPNCLFRIGGAAMVLSNKCVRFRPPRLRAARLPTPHCLSVFGMS